MPHWFNGELTTGWWPQDIAQVCDGKYPAELDGGVFETSRFPRSHFPLKLAFQDAFGNTHEIGIERDGEQFDIVVPINKHIEWNGDERDSTTLPIDFTCLGLITFHYERGSLIHNHGIRIHVRIFHMPECGWKQPTKGGLPAGQPAPHHHKTEEEWKKEKWEKEQWEEQRKKQEKGGKGEEIVHAGDLAIVHVKLQHKHGHEGHHHIRFQIKPKNPHGVHLVAIHYRVEGGEEWNVDINSADGEGFWEHKGSDMPGSPMAKPGQKVEFWVYLIRHGLGEEVRGLHWIPK